MLVYFELWHVEPDSSQEGTAVQLLVRGKLIPAQVSASSTWHVSISIQFHPFITSYYKVAQKV